jgi:HPt (histidine-containing phosphotransfer) domain-containing protein
MDGQFNHVNLDYLDDISGGDVNFKRELIGIFLKQIPEFMKNLYYFLRENKYEDLAKEAHTAKSSVLIFMMEETGKDLKKIQLLAENNQTEDIPSLIEKVRTELDGATKELTEFLNYQKVAK